MAKKKKTAAAPPAATEKPAETPLAQPVAEAIAGLIYISESEAPLELEAWPEVTDTASLQAKITATLGIPPAAQTLVPPDDFLSAIQQMADPSDPVMVDYASRYGKLFTLLKSGGGDIIVLRAAGGQLHLFIAAFGNQGPVIIHTTAVET